MAPHYAPILGAYTEPIVPKVHLTDISVRALKAPETGQLTYWDDTPGFGGFGCRISPGGTKTFILVHGTDRKRKRQTIGRFPVVTLSQARQKAKEILAHKTLGIETPKPDHGTTFEQALPEFIRAYRAKNRPKTAAETERLLNRHFLPRFTSTDIREIRTQDLIAIIDHIPAPGEQHHAFVAGRTLFNWLVSRRTIPVSPFSGVKSPRRLFSRDRTLSEAEVVRLYHAAERYGYPFGTIVQLLILTGQRRGEVSALRWEWINQDTRSITIPKEFTKNGRAHTFPYGEMVATILKSVPTKQGYIFPARGSSGERSFNGWSHSKALLERSMLKDDVGGPLDPLPQFGLHDLRRSAATIWASLGVAPHVVEKLLNHSSGIISGIAAIYNRFQYAEECRAAIAAYEEKLSSLLNT
jgi:integrase